MTTLRSRRAGGQGPRTLIAAGALSLALAGASASFAGPTVGVIVPKGSGFGKEIKEKFAERLKELGIEAEVHVQTPGCDKVSRANAVRKLLAYEMDAVVVFGTCAAQDAADASKKIPVLLLGGSDPTWGRGERPEWMGSNVAAVACRTSVPFLFDNMENTLELSAVGVLQCTDSEDSTAQLKGGGGGASGNQYLADGALGREGQTVITLAAFHCAAMMSGMPPMIPTRTFVDEADSSPGRSCK